MRKIIDGRTYNTETAKELGNWYNTPDESDFTRCEETLYRTTKGAYFLHGEGGPMSPYARSIGQNSWTGSAEIVPLTEAEAREWAEQHLDAEEYEAAFGETEEAGSDLVTRERVNLTLANETIALLRRLSAETDVPMARMVDRAVMEMYGRKEIK